MMESTMCLLECINPLIKLVKDRQQLYFQLLGFVNDHIHADSNDLDSLTVFGRFIAHIHAKNIAVKLRQEELIEVLVESAVEIAMEESIAKEMLRFSSRVIEMLEASTSRVRKSVFDESGRAVREFARFKSTLGQILKREQLNAREYCEYIINFTAKKYGKQANKLQKYLDKIEQGEDICLRDFYTNHISDHDHSEEKKRKVEEIPIRRVDFKLEIKQMSPEQEKKHSIKKTLKPSTKRRERPHHQKHKQKPHEHKREKEEKEQKPNKEQTVNKLLKFYSLLQLNKKEFLEDYIYEQIEEQKKSKELLLKLIERNRQINTQISNYVRKSCTYIPVPLIIIPPLNKSSGDERNQSSLASRNSLKINFIIKRKSTSRVDSSGNEKQSDTERKKEEEQEREGSVVKNISRRRSSRSNHRDAESKKKLFVAKPPLVFQDDMIPQAQLNQTQWLHAPLSNRYRNEHLRLKKKPNPTPMDRAVLPDNFRYLM